MPRAIRFPTNASAKGGDGDDGGGDGLGMGGGVYNLGTFTFDVFTVIANNHPDDKPTDTRIHANLWQGKFPYENTADDGYERTSPWSRSAGYGKAAEPQPLMSAA